jgi:hypothetical protein
MHPLVMRDATTYQHSYDSVLAVSTVTRDFEESHRGSCASRATPKRAVARFREAAGS